MDVGTPGWGYPRTANATLVRVETGEQMGLSASRCLAGTGRSAPTWCRGGLPSEPSRSSPRSAISFTTSVIHRDWGFGSAPG